MGTPARFPFGVNNASSDPDELFRDLPQLSPLKLFFEHIDFSGLDYLTTAWTVTETQAAATQSLVASDAGGEYGLLALVNSAGAPDINSIQLTTPSIFISDTKKKWWLWGRLSRDNADEKMGFGLQPANATPFTLANAIWAQVDSASSAVDFKVAKASAITTASIAAAYAASALNTFLSIGMYYNGKDKINCYAGSSLGARIQTLTNIPTGVALMPTISAMNTTANARNVHVDYFGFAVER